MKQYDFIPNKYHHSQQNNHLAFKPHHPILHNKTSKINKTFFLDNEILASQWNGSQGDSALHIKLDKERKPSPFWEWEKNLTGRSHTLVRLYQGNVRSIIQGGTKPGIISWMRPANERRRYNITSSHIGWAHTQNDPYKEDMNWIDVYSATHWGDPYIRQRIGSSLFQVMTGDHFVCVPSQWHTKSAKFHKVKVQPKLKKSLDYDWNIVRSESSKW